MAVSSLPHAPGRPGPIWVDGDAYCRDALLGGGPTPWTDTGALASYTSRSVALLGTDGWLFDVGEAWSTRLADPDLLAAMSRQTRRGRPLRTLLDDEGGRALVTEALLAEGAASPVPLVAVVPSPARWARLANVAAGLPDEPCGEDTVDAAAMYLAGSLSVLADAPVAALLVDEDEAAADAYQPIGNAAAHLGLPVVVRTDTAPCWPLGPVAGVAAWIGSGDPGPDAGPWGIVADLAESLPPGSEGAPRIVRVARDADPDRVTATVRSWG